ncbi:MAG: M20/M25/M40 family metallo-hydrolase [Proteobacteria bacterium]|nr:M20/M25/M40 family metallo-hydrolase [Pseudomonadota bacterium]
MLTSCDQEQFFKLIKKLAITPGPSLGEAPRRSVLEGFFLEHKVSYQVDMAGNLWVSYGQGSWTDTVVFDAHMDVVQEGYTKFVEERDGCIRGLGLGDNLTAVTLLAMLAVDLQKKAPGFRRPLNILFSIGEEGEGNLKGVRQVVQDHDKAPYAFVSFDLSFDEYSLAGLGSNRYAVEMTCPGGHSWSDYGLPGAIDQMMQCLTSLKEKVRELSHENPGCLSFNIGTIQGGEGINSIARKAQARFEFRSTNPQYLKILDHEVGENLAMVNRIPGVSASCTLIGSRPAAPPVCPERTEPHVVRILAELDEKTRPVVRSTNINATLAAGWPSICLGLCESGRFHSHDEYVVINSLEKGWSVLVKLAQTLLEKAP